MNELRIPLATYRLQFHAGFRFSDAEAIVPYLHKLGITDVYASPLLKSRKGSIHGYDVVDHSQLNPEIGSEEEFHRLSDSLKSRDMGLVVDVVPNHMEIDDPANRWWQDVLENGPSSPYAKYFDIDWNPPKPQLRNRVLLPVLGGQYGEVLESGEISVSYANGAFSIAYYDRRFPIDPRTASMVLDAALEHVRYLVEADDPDLIELQSIVTALGYLPERTERDPKKVEERQREKEVAKQRLSELVEASPLVSRAVDTAVAQINGRKNEPGSFDHLAKLLERQAYRLCYWRVAADEINYRRFFDIDDLGAIRVEEPDVFEAVHDVVLGLVGEGRVSGMRIDHPDGLVDPELYFMTLQAEARSAITGGEVELPKLPLKGLDCAVYVVAEKILSHDEHLPERWSIHGTTGYEMLNLINGVFVDPSAAGSLLDFYARVTQRTPNFDDFVYEGKKLILDVSMSSELHVLARRLDRISEHHRWSRDFTFWSLHKALSEVIACFPVYRTYVRRETIEPSSDDRHHIELAVRRAKRRNPAIDPSIYDFIASVLLLDDPDGISDLARAERREFVLRVQQLTGSVMAKGFEDTAFYRAYPLASLNEVGGEPKHFGVSLEEFHRHNAERAERWPYGMIASSTHDTKRSEDVRARLNVISEIPEQWAEAVRRWQELNRPHKNQVEGHAAPDDNEEYLLYQTLIGVWPLNEMDNDTYEEFVNRLVAYMEKALKEAKVHTSWINPNADYDQAVAKFVRTLLDRGGQNKFLVDLQEFRKRVDYAGVCNSLAQLVLKSTVPGVPDFYQGTELFELSLVDPDNRRPVDFQKRMGWLDDLERREADSREQLLSDLLANWQDGGLKLYVAYRILNFRRKHAAIFLDGDYQVPTVRGARSEHVCIFTRQRSERRPSSAEEATRAVMVVVPRWLNRLAEGRQFPLDAGVWGDTAIEISADGPQRWRDVFTGVEHNAEVREEKAWLPVAALLSRFPVAVLEAASSD